jgi:hypothetical protein
LVSGFERVFFRSLDSSEEGEDEDDEEEEEVERGSDLSPFVSAWSFKEEDEEEVERGE